MSLLEFGRFSPYRRQAKTLGAVPKLVKVYCRGKGAVKLKECLVMVPFFSREHGELVVDKRCSCGHPRRFHGSTLHPLPDGKLLREAHGGNCRLSDDCPCSGFEWDGWVTVGDLLEYMGDEVKV